METRMDLRSKVFLFFCSLVLTDRDGHGRRPATGACRAGDSDKACRGRPGGRTASNRRCRRAAVDVGGQVAKISSQPSRDRFGYRGQVVDPDGKPFQGAKIYLLWDGCNGIEQRFLPIQARATSGADGGFHFTAEQSDFVAPPPYDCVVVATADGYGPARGNPSAFEESGNLKRIAEEIYGPRKDDSQKPVLRLARDDVPLTGRVVDASGRPVAGAKARVLSIYAQKDE